MKPTSAQRRCRQAFRLRREWKRLFTRRGRSLLYLKQRYSWAIAHVVHDSISFTEVGEKVIYK